MRLSGVVAAVVLCLAGSVYGTDYYWAGTGTNYSSTSYWDCATNWRYVDNEIATDYPRLSTDRALFTWSTATRRARLVDALNITVGEIIFGTYGGFAWSGADNVRINLSSASGYSGAFDAYNGDTYGVGTNNIVTMDGNFLYTGGGTRNVTMVMTGVNKYYRETPNTNRAKDFNLIIDGGVIYDNLPGSPNHFNIRSLTIMNNGTFAAGATYGASDYFLDIRRTLTVEPGSKVLGSIRFQNMDRDNNTWFYYTVPGISYGRDLRFATSYAGKTAADGDYANANRTDSWVQRNITGGDMTVGRDLIFEQQSGFYARSYRYVLDTRDNDTGVSRNVAIRRNLSMGGQDSALAGYLFRLNDSVVDVDCDVLVGGVNVRANSNTGNGCSALDLGTATLRVGGNFQVNRRFNTTTKTYDPTRYIESAWNPGTSTVIFDGNGTVKTQTLYPDNVPFYNVFINTPGIVQMNTGTGVRDMQDRLLIKGSFEVQAGTFYQANKPITFNGDCHTLEVHAGAIVQGTVGTTKTNGVFDNIVLAPDAVLLLGSDIAISSTDNLVMGSGSKLYLCGFTLAADGEVYDGTLPQTWTNDGGTIYGTLAIPEPGTLLLIGTGALGALGWVRRKRMT